MRIIAGTWRGRALTAPPSDAIRPTADRVRQALFDMLMHAPWAGSGAVRDARVLDAFAGTGALGLEALSRGAAHATFIERDPVALRTLRANIAACGADDRCRVIAGDALAPPAGQPCRLIFLDPPYGRDLVAHSLDQLAGSGWIAPEALIVVETARTEIPALAASLLAERIHGAARITVWRMMHA